MQAASNGAGLAIEWAGEKLSLLPERALWWPHRETLFVADIHIGKAGAFREAGVPVPEFTHQSDLDRLSRALLDTRATRLVILGDLLHAPCAKNETVINGLRGWRAQHPDLDVVLVPGNHDRGPIQFLEELGIGRQKAPWLFAPFVCLHEPEHWTEGFALAGHWHPGFRLSDSTGAGLRTPCFYFGGSVAVLPAFGEFTGTKQVERKSGDRIFAVNGEEVIEL